MRVRFAIGMAVLAAVLVVPALASANHIPLCPDDRDDPDPIEPTRTFRGEFPAPLGGSYVLLPFKVPRGTTAVRVRYCYDHPENNTPVSRTGHTLDLGIYEARSNRRDRWDRDEFRGWGGSSHPDVTVAPNGFSSPARYEARPRTNVPGRTTRGFEPGPIPPGLWAVELGLSSIERIGDTDGAVPWRVDVELIRERRYANRPYRPAPYRAPPARRRPGWYAGDFHVHAEHSNLGAATMRETFEYAFKPLAEGGAGLDFLTLSDYVGRVAWGEIGRYQRDYPRKLIIRSAEVITYSGHLNNHASNRFVEYRAGPVYVRGPRGRLRRVRGPIPPRRIFRSIRRAGGWTQINHPAIFSSEVPGFSSLCRGCPWDYSPVETGYRLVDAIEIATGPAGLKLAPQPGPNPFTPLALDFYEEALASGAHIAAVGGSDSHHAGHTEDKPEAQVTQVPVGYPTTVVYAPALSERGIRHAVRAGHTYVKLFGNDGPDLRFSGRAMNGKDAAIMGGRLEGDAAALRARIIGAGPSAARPGPYILNVMRNGEPMLSVPVVGDDFTLPFTASEPGRYALLLTRQSGVAAIEAYSTPIWLTG